MNKLMDTDKAIWRADIRTREAPTYVKERCLRLLLLLFCLPALSADPGDWTSLGPNGGLITSLSIDPHHAGTVCAATWSQVLFKTTDGGTTWSDTVMPNGHVVFDPQDPSRMYVAQWGVSKSTDGGVTWSDSSSGLPWDGAFVPVQVLAIDPQASDTVYAACLVFGSGAPLYKTTDEGLLAGREPYASPVQRHYGPGDRSPKFKPPVRGDQPGCI
jgi:hypothetical protein